MPTQADYSQAVDDFRRARRRAALYNVYAAWVGKSPALLSYDDVRQKLKARETPKTELKEIPLDSIVGSVGRYGDFTRGFLPRSASDEGRWAKVKVAVTDQGGVPPIEVYQIGDAYFVLDGNHRVSVARDLAATHIEAYVRQVDTKVPLSPDIQPDELILKAEYADFLEQTAINEIIPETNLEVTSPGRYPFLLDQMRAHQDHLQRTEQRQIPLNEAVESWYEQVYLPTLLVIRQRGLLRDFPGRTETDLYIWLSQNRDNLEQSLGWEVKPETVATNLAAQTSPRLGRRLSRARQKLISSLTPDPIDPGPAPGEWRREHLDGQAHDGFVEDILVPIGGEGLNRCALDQALTIAQREQARLQGLFVVTTEGVAEAEEAGRIRAEFERRCAEANIPGRLAVETGEPAPMICKRAAWTDLVVLDLAHPPGDRTIARLGSGIRKVILRCPTPVLAVPGSSSPMKHALLAYDGSPKSKEALYLSTYLACRWEISLTILTVKEEGRLPEETLLEAAVYVEDHGFEPVVVSAEGDITEAVLQTTQERDCDFVIMGGYGQNPIVEAALGSTVDKILRATEIPVLICR